MSKRNPLRALIVVLAMFSAAGIWGIAARGAAPTASEPSIERPQILTGLDLDGRTHRFASGEGYRAAVLVFLTSECPVAREYVPELNRIAKSLADKPVKFCGVIYEPNSTRAAAKKFQTEFKIEFPILFDASGELAATLTPERVPEVFVLEESGKVAYRGRIDDRYGDIGKKRTEATTHELTDAVDALLAGQPVKVAQTEVVGCPLETKLAANPSAKVTYNRDIAPIVYSQCAECHRPGEVAPFALLSYEDAAKRAEHLAEVTKSRQMPPWKAAIGHGRFLGERQLTATQVALFEAWAKSGAAEGNPDDLPPAPKFASGWRLGEPGLVLKAPEAFTMPADGPDIFQHIIIPLDAAAGKTVVGFEFRPGNPAIVHHAILFLDRSGLARKKDAATPEPGYTTSGSIDIPVAGMLGVWTPGMTPRYYPQDVGTPIAAGTDLVLQLHLHPSGKVESDQSSIALYYAKDGETPSKATSIFLTGTLLIDIPAGSATHEVKSTVTLPAELTLIALLPHMHIIGREMKITATLPDGKIQPLVWIDDWNFYWQDNYVYQTPVTLPAGTKLETLARYNNSADNPANPSKPPKRVLFGNDSDDEMCFGIFQIIEGKPEDQRKTQRALLQSFFSEWSKAKIDADARAHIMEEAGKLFGGGIEGGPSLESLLDNGGLGRRNRDRDPAKSQDDGKSANPIVAPGD